MLLNLLQLNKTELCDSNFCRFILAVVRPRNILNTWEVSINSCRTLP